MEFLGNPEGSFHGPYTDKNGFGKSENDSIEKKVKVLEWEVLRQIMLKK